MEKKTLMPPGFEQTTFVAQVGRSATSAILPRCKPEPKSLVYIYNGKTSPSLSRLAGIGNLGKIFVDARYI